MKSVSATLQSLNIDHVNIALMALSVVIAYCIPFELVLFSYAFLGPAHYLTQISWMHDRAYFSNAKWLWAPFSALTAIIIGFLAIQSPHMDFVNFIVIGSTLAIAIAFVIGKCWPTRIAIILGLMLGFALLYQANTAFVAGALLLIPTIIHIYVFTGLFILVGALRNNTVSGYLSLIIFTGAGLIFFIIPPAEVMYMERFVSNNIGYFENVSYFLANLLSFGGWVDSMSTLGLLSFAYTYHYLNWFSKTEVIKWHKIPKTRGKIIIAIYVCSLAIYLWNYTYGFLVLLFLSLLHVFLEFPLNVLTFKNIGGLLRQRLGF